MADEPDSKSGALHCACGFKSHLRHHCKINNIGATTVSVGQYRTMEAWRSTSIAAIVATAKLGTQKSLDQANLRSARRAGSVAPAQYSPQAKLARVSRRQSTGKWEWEEAKAVAAQWEQSGSWDGRSSVAATPLQDVAAPARVRRFRERLSETTR